MGRTFRQTYALRRAALLPVAVALSLCAPTRGQHVDDFQDGGWEAFATTPGVLTITENGLHLVDGPEDPSWFTVSRTFTVDVDKTPLFLVAVHDLSDSGTVKLIRKTPFDKRVSVRIDRPGLYAVDMRQAYGWKGRNDIEVCLYALGDEEAITYAWVKFAAALTPEEKGRIQDRPSTGNVRLQVDDFELVPLFVSCSYYFRSEPRPGLRASVRRAGRPWQAAPPGVYVAADRMFRGSVVGLAEDTAYELRITDADGMNVAGGAFRTWRSDVPVARTIVLDDSTFSGHLTIADQGRPEGWIRYTSRDGFVLRNDRAGPLIEVTKATYVLLDGLTLRGGLQQALTIRACENVRVVNCDIAGWGRTGTQRFDRDGKFYTEAGAAINWDSAILISRSTGTVVERCLVHDPVGTANSWYLSHPAGPEALGIDKPRATVVRFNDFIGSDLHRWNDAIEGTGNFHVDGGFNRDADIYGNFICFANDDALEIDGGQTNVRVFQNRCEGCLCGISIQGCMSGPSYLFRNLLVHMGDERGLAGQTIKVSSHANGPDATSFIFNNTCYGPSSDLRLLRNLRIVAKNNLFAGTNGVRGYDDSPQSDCDYNLSVSGAPDDEPHGTVAAPGFVAPAAGDFSLRPTSPAIGRGTPIAGIAPGTREGRVDLGALPGGSDAAVPFRPIPLVVSKGQISFPPLGSAGRQTVPVTVRLAGAARAPRRFRVARNEACDWFDVQPASGLLQPGQAMDLTVSLHPGRMTRRALYRGAFLVRLDDGFSRPVTVYAPTTFRPSVKPNPGGAWVTYLEAEAPAGGLTGRPVLRDVGASGEACVLLSPAHGTASLDYAFTVPAKGHYVVVLRIRSAEPVGSHDALLFGLDGGEMGRSQLRSSTSWTWSLAAQNRRMSLICLQPFPLDPGPHTLRLAPQDPLRVDLIAVTDDPRVFE